MTPPKTLTIGTRGSPLALRQTQEIVKRLEQAHPEIQFHVKVRRIRTEGDRARNVPLQQLAGRGVFVKDIEDALLAGELDLAVHSLKDMTSQLPPGLALAAVGEREDVRDVLVSRWNLPLAQLPPGARLGTGSTRRAAQLKALRPDFQIADIRGNVDTRLRKAEGAEFDGVVLAAAGLRRMDLQDRITEYIPPEIMLPAVGQGALAVETRSDDEATLAIVATIDHWHTHVAVAAERAFLRALGGGCEVPIAAWGRVEEEWLVLDGLVIALDGTRAARGSVTGKPDEPEDLGEALAQHVLARGAREILQGAAT